MSGVDPTALGAWLREHVGATVGPVEVEPLSGGSSNLTFRVRDGVNDWVLRRPPLSHVLDTANDMRREYTVQRCLLATDVPVARVVAVCEDDSVLGAPFYLMEWLDGVVYDTVEAVGHLDEDQAMAAAAELMEVLARLHAVDPDAVGLGDFGRPAGFVARQVRRWSTQWERSKQRELPEIDEVARRLADAVPPEGPPGIVHGDYSFNNTMWRCDNPARMLGILDWEMSTLGDPLTDVGMVAVYWGHVGEFMWRHRAPQPHRLNRGFPTVDGLLDLYAEASGRDLSNLAFYRALATFKLAVISEGAHARRAATDPEAATAADAAVRQLAAFAHEAVKDL